MKVIDGKFGNKSEDKKEITTSEFLSAFVVKALQHEEEGRKVKVAVVMYEDGEMFEVASNEQYPDGVYQRAVPRWRVHASANGVTGNH
jgi:hypothetical protein